MSAPAAALDELAVRIAEETIVAYRAYLGHGYDERAASDMAVAEILEGYVVDLDALGEVAP